MKISKEFVTICYHQKPVYDAYKASWLAIVFGSNIWIFVNFSYHNFIHQPFFNTTLNNHELRARAYEEDKALDHNMAFYGQKEYSIGGHGCGRETRQLKFNSQGRGFITSNRDMVIRIKLIVIKEENNEQNRILISIGRISVGKYQL